MNERTYFFTTQKGVFRDEKPPFFHPARIAFAIDTGIYLFLFNTTYYISKCTDMFIFACTVRKECVPLHGIREEITTYPILSRHSDFSLTPTPLQPKIHTILHPYPLNGKVAYS